MRGVPIFVDFVVDQNHEIKNPTKGIFSGDMYNEKCRATNLRIHEPTNSQQSTKIDAHE